MRNRTSAWTTGAGEPRLVRDVLLVDTHAGHSAALVRSGWIDPRRSPAASAMERPGAGLRAGRLDARPRQDPRIAGHAFHRISSSHKRPRPPGGRSRPPRGHLSRSRLATTTLLIAPVTLVEMPDGRRGPPKVTISGFTLVRLDPAVMRDTLLASLTARHFHGDDEEVDYRVAVVDRNDPSKVVWESEPGIATAIVASPDVTQHFMAPRPDQMFIFARGAGPRERPAAGTPPPPPRRLNHRAALRGVNRRRASGEGSRGRAPRQRRRIGDRARRPGRRPHDDTHRPAHTIRWPMGARRQAPRGVARGRGDAARTRNLMLSSGILALLAMAVGLIVVSSRRAHRLARQQSSLSRRSRTSCERRSR